MNLYVIRHGQTNWNAKGIVQGRSNNRLSELGKKQVKESALKLKDVKIDLIFSSPLMRTMQTANIMNEYHHVKVIKDERLTEMDEGIFARRLKSSLSEEEKERKKSRDQKLGLESKAQVYVRIKDFLEFLKREYGDKNVLIVTHHACARIIEYVFSYDEFDLKKLEMINYYDNAELRKVV